MRHTTTKNIKNAYNTYLHSCNCDLHDCYSSFSRNKQKAFNYCLSLVKQYNGQAWAIIGFNSQTFSFGFLGEINGKQAFFYITKSYDRFIYLDEM